MITFYSHKTSPNGWKVANVLEELGLSYETKFIAFEKGEQSSPEFKKLNPYGRIPVIVDHDNNDFVIWESICIIKYLADRYDKERKISFAPGTNDYYYQDQWLTFSSSAQGPYFGQVGMFLLFHPENIPSVVENYLKEADRVVSALDSALANKKYLVGEKFSIVDLAFSSWNDTIHVFNAHPRAEGVYKIDLDKYPNYQRWDQELKARPGVAKNKKMWTENVSAFQN